MLQRVALAAAMVHEPEVFILDEPMSGLDPVGRKEVRDIILEEAQKGRTVFFSSHILSDVEMLCDRVCILRKGEVALSGRIKDLLSEDRRCSEITLEGANDACCRALAGLARASRRVGDAFVMEVEGDVAVHDALKRALSDGARVRSVVVKRETLEELFVREAL